MRVLAWWIRRFITLSALAGLLAGCASAPPLPPPPLADARFAPPTVPVGAQELFALTDPMLDFLRREVAPRARRDGPAHALIDALNDRARLKLEYDASRTRTAGEAFEARAGNCLSLLVMTSAMARELGLSVQYQSAYLEDTWSRSGDLHIASGHVNIVLNPVLTDMHYKADTTRLLVDFLPAESLRGMRTRMIEQRTVVAMFLANRATEALMRGAVDDAYWWARAAIRADPAYANAYNTLGVVYQRHGDLDLAAQVFDHLLGADPAHRHALHNQMQVLGQLGRAGESDLLRQRLARLEPEPPFKYFDEGRQAMARGDYRAARELFAREVARAGYNDEFHFWLGLAHWRLGDVAQARLHLEHARDASTQRGDRERYAAKLQALRALSAAVP